MVSVSLLSFMFTDRVVIITNIIVSCLQCVQYYEYLYISARESFSLYEETVSVKPSAHVCPRVWRV